MTRRDGASAPKHTPGPWHYDKYGPAIVASANPPEPADYLSENFDDKILFELQSAVGGGSCAEANCFLIAAAPDLLEALKDARYALYGNGPGNPKIDTAIAKAEGGAA